MSGHQLGLRPSPCSGLAPLDVLRIQVTLNALECSGVPVAFCLA